YLRVGAPEAESLSAFASPPAPDPVTLEGQRLPPAWSRTKKNASRMPPDQRSDIGATASTTPKSTKMLLEPVRLLKLTQTTDVASGYILDGLTVQSKVTFLNGLTRGSRSCGSCEEVVVKLQSPHARAQSHQGRRANKGFLPVDLCDLGSYA